jgi:hypothetical protein
MRLPISKVYRGFPELDRFSDEQCSAYVTTAERANLLGRLAVQGIVLLMFLPGSCVGGGLMIWAAHLVFGDPDEADWTLLASGLLMTLGVAAPCIGALMVRDTWLRRMIRRQLERCMCPSCRYSLLGLRPANGSVVCPECGAKHELASMGLEPADILAPVLVSGDVLGERTS